MIDREKVGNAIGGAFKSVASSPKRLVIGVAVLLALLALIAAF